LADSVFFFGLFKDSFGQFLGFVALWLVPMVFWFSAGLFHFFGQFSVLAASFDCFLAGSVRIWPDQKCFCQFSAVAAGANCFLAGSEEFQLFYVVLWLV
jgi:hypothetical protein